MGEEHSNTVKTETVVSLRLFKSVKVFHLVFRLCRPLPLVVGNNSMGCTIITKGRHQ